MSTPSETPTEVCEEQQQLVASNTNIPFPSWESLLNVTLPSVSFQTNQETKNVNGWFSSPINLTLGTGTTMISTGTGCLPPHAGATYSKIGLIDFTNDMWRSLHRLDDHVRSAGRSAPPALDGPAPAKRRKTKNRREDFVSMLSDAKTNDNDDSIKYPRTLWARVALPDSKGAPVIRVFKRPAHTEVEWPTKDDMSCADNWEMGTCSSVVRGSRIIVELSARRMWAVNGSYGIAMQAVSMLVVPPANAVDGMERRVVSLAGLLG